MIRQGLIEQEVLHEIAMSIGESIELESMLAECIPVFLRGLGCATAAVLLRDEQDDFYTQCSDDAFVRQTGKAIHILKTR